MFARCDRIKQPEREREKETRNMYVWLRPSVATATRKKQIRIAMTLSSFERYFPLETVAKAIQERGRPAAVWRRKKNPSSATIIVPNHPLSCPAPCNHYVVKLLLKVTVKYLIYLVAKIFLSRLLCLWKERIMLLVFRHRLSIPRGVFMQFFFSLLIF